MRADQLLRLLLLALHLFALAPPGLILSEDALHVVVRQESLLSWLAWLDRQQRANMIYGGPPGVWPGDDVLMDALEEQGLPREWGLTGKWEQGPTYEQIQAIDAKYKPALNAWVDSLGLRQAKKYLDNIDMKLTGAGRAKKKSLLTSQNPQQSLGVS